MKKLNSFQQKQLDELRSSDEYMDASVWTIIYDLLSDGHDKGDINAIIDMIEDDLEDEIP